MTTLAWTTPRVPSAETIPFETVAPPCDETPRPWILLLGGSDAVVADAARAGDPVIAPPETPPLPIAAHLLPPPGLSGPRTLYLPRLERAFVDGIGCAGTALYLLAKITALATEGEPLAVYATASEEGAAELVSQRGLASRFEIRRARGDTAPPRDRETLPPTDPDTALGSLFRAASLLEERELEGAIAALRRAIALDPELAAAHYELGKALIHAVDMDGAIAAFRATTELLPEYSSAWANLGAALGEIRRLDDAADALQRAVALDPLSHALHSNLGVTYRDHGRLDEAETALGRALELEPRFVFGHYNLASVRYLAGRYRDAITCFERARSLEPRRSPRQDLLLAVTRLASGDVEGALSDYRDAFGRADEGMKRELRSMAEWDLEELSRRSGVTAGVRQAVSLVRSFA